MTCKFWNEEKIVIPWKVEVDAAAIWLDRSATSASLKRAFLQCDFVDTSILALRYRSYERFCNAISLTRAFLHCDFYNTHVIALQFHWHKRFCNAISSLDPGFKPVTRSAYIQRSFSSWAHTQNFERFCITAGTERLKINLNEAHTNTANCGQLLWLRAVISETRDPRFESNLQILYYLYTVSCIEITEIK